MSRISFEFFPAKTDAGHAKLQTVRDQLATQSPDFFSVTYGAGGSTQERTLSTVTEFNQKGISTAPHLTCVGASKASLTELLDQYKAAGVNRIVTLRGDLPNGENDLGELKYATDLVSFIKDQYNDQFHLEVAAYPEKHPQATHLNADIQNYAAKVKAGADSAITQYFFNAECYFNFVEQAQKAGADIPVYPGIMPIINFTNLIRFSEGCGAEIPRWMREQLGSYTDQESIMAAGHDMIANLTQKLIDGGAPGVHFYSMNQAEPTLKLLDAVGLRKA